MVSRAHRLRVGSIVALVLLALAGAVLASRRASRREAAREAAKVTFTKDIAPLVFAKCVPCHRPNGAGPFSLIDFDDVTSHATDIRKVTRTRFMPPWRPAPGYAEYANDRSLSNEQIDLIARWMDGGELRGDPRDMPALPAMNDGWQLGEPDLVVRLGAPYALAAEGKDVYRNFVIRTPVPATRFVKAWELRPGTRAIHHAIMNIDRYGLARRRDDADPEPGFGGMDVGDVQSADGFYLVWTPGKFATPPDPTAAFRVDDHTDFVLQLHMQPTGKPETVNPTIGLYFADRPPTRPRFTLRIGDMDIDIPAGEQSYVAKADYVLPADVDVLTVFPHAHYVATKVRTWATLPDGSVRGLLKIDDWDFDWQDEYTFARPVSLPRGTTIAMEFVYDNSTRNPRNPQHPPQRVRSGERSIDEMGNVTFQVVPHDATGMNLLRESKYRRILRGAETARNHYNLANALSDLGKKDEAIEHYRRAVELEPSLVLARFNMALLLLGAGKPDEAIVQLRAVVKAKPDDVVALVTLGNAFRAKHELDTSLVHYRSAVAVDGTNALARYSLGVALRDKGDTTGALEQLRAAVALQPTAKEPREALDALLASSDADGGAAGADAAAH